MVVPAPPTLPAPRLADHPMTPPKATIRRRSVAVNATDAGRWWLWVPPVVVAQRMAKCQAAGCPAASGCRTAGCPATAQHPSQTRPCCRARAGVVVRAMLGSVRCLSLSPMQGVWFGGRGRTLGRQPLQTRPAPLRHRHRSTAMARLTMRCPHDHRKPSQRRRSHTVLGRSWRHRLGTHQPCETPTRRRHLVCPSV